MKTRKNRDIIVFIILIPIFLYLAFFISERLSGKLPQYSVINKSKTGYSVIFKALRRLKYDCKRELKPVEQQSTDGFQIVADLDSSFNIDADAVKNWIQGGGKLVYLTPFNSEPPRYGTAIDKKALVLTYTYGKGCIITADANYFMNKTLVKNKGTAYEILKAADKQGNGAWTFNENHLYAQASSASLWSYIPLEVRFMIYQFMLAVVAFFYYKGKRFGKPIPFYEEVERDENEYLYAAAALYKQANCWDVMLENYYRNFLNNIEGDKQEWLSDWRQNELPHLKKAEKLKSFMDGEKRHIKKKEYIEMISIIEDLIEILKKRREAYWKTVKKLS